MNWDIGHQNTQWTEHLFDAFLEQNIRYFCLSPGSRLAPLILALNRKKEISTCVHFDERGTAFHALGYGKATSSPAVMIATSGSALGNLYPAIMEASMSRIPLILLTADRPPELRDCGSNQTIDQVKIFGNFLRWQIDLPCPHPSLSSSYLKNTIAHAVFRASHYPPGPVQINCMLQEPFFSDTPSTLQSASLSTQHAPVFTTLAPDFLIPYASLFSQFKRGLILVGNLPYSPEKQLAILKLAKLLGWPVFADLLSNLRGTSHSNLINHYDLILKAGHELDADCILHFGDQLISKTLLLALGKHKGTYIHITDHLSRQDPNHVVTHRLVCEPNHFAEEILPYVDETVDSDFLLTLRESAELVQQEVTRCLDEEKELTEPLVAYLLQKHLPKQHALFVANSMPVRDADLFFFPQDHSSMIFANRGTSGIDGNIATVIGIAQGLKKPVVALLGDQTFLHDLNSLAMVRTCQYPVIFLVVNNGGGGIFSFLPIAKKTEVLDHYFAAAHDYSFESLAQFFHLSYFKPHVPQEFLRNFQQLLASEKSGIIEITTHRQDNVLHHQSLYEKIKDLLVENVSTK